MAKTTKSDVEPSSPAASASISSGALAALYAKQLILELPTVANMRDPGEDGRDAAHLVNALRRLFFDTLDQTQSTVFVEIGCHHAEASRQFVEGRDGRRAFAFEAIPAIFEEALDLCRDLPIQLFNLAVGSRDGETIFHVPREDRLKVWGSTRKRTDVQVPTDQIVVEMARLDTLADRLDMTVSGRAAALWMDVEGAVLDILRGGASFLRSSVSVLYVEMYERAFFESRLDTLDIYELLIEAGFIPVARDNQFPGAYNLVAVHQNVYRHCYELIASHHIKTRKIGLAAHNAPPPRICPSA